MKFSIRIHHSYRERTSKKGIYNRRTILSKSYQSLRSEENKNIFESQMDTKNKSIEASTNFPRFNTWSVIDLATNVEYNIEYKNCVVNKFGAPIQDFSQVTWTLFLDD